MRRTLWGCLLYLRCGLGGGLRGRCGTLVLGRCSPDRLAVEHRDGRPILRGLNLWLHGWLGLHLRWHKDIVLCHHRGRPLCGLCGFAVALIAIVLTVVAVIAVVPDVTTVVVTAVVVLRWQRWLSGQCGGGLRVALWVALNISLTVARALVAHAIAALIAAPGALWIRRCRAC